MSNMSYCRFENTDSDLAACQDALEALFQGDGKLSARELTAAKSLVTRCRDITVLLANEVGTDVGDLEEPDTDDAFDKELDEANDAAEEGDG